MTAQNTPAAPAALDSEWDPYHRWTWHPASVVQARGPETHREATDDDPAFEPPKQRLGFAPPPAPPVDEPLTWHGDDS